MDEAKAAYADQVEEKHMERLENGMKNRQEQVNQLLERLKEHVNILLSVICMPSQLKNNLSHIIVGMYCVRGNMYRSIIENVLKP